MLRLYVNGSRQGPPFLGTPPVSSPTTDWMIGAGSPQDQNQAIYRYWIGVIDEVEIFNRALVANEIKELFEMGVGGKCKGPCWPRAMVSIQVVSGSTVIISWTGSGILQSAPTVYGTWTTISGTSPHTTTLSGTGNQFFRVICN